MAMYWTAIDFDLFGDFWASPGYTWADDRHRFAQWYGQLVKPRASCCRPQRSHSCDLPLFSQVIQFPLGLQMANIGVLLNFSKPSPRTVQMSVSIQNATAGFA